MSVAIPIASIGSTYDRYIVDTGREAEFLFFVAFLVTAIFIRTSAHMIRAQVSWWPGNVEVGGTHIHHLVWGICLLLIFGWIGITQDLDSPWLQIVAVLFGVGTGLTLDEFALWLNLRDVYWEKEGRESIRAVVFVAALTGLLLVGLRGWGEAATGVENVILNVIGVSWIITVGTVIVCVTKGRYGLALVGFFLNPFSIYGAIRLARPTSLWAKHRYDEAKLERARRRFEHERGPLAAIDRKMHHGAT